MVIVSKENGTVALIKYVFVILWKKKGAQKSIVVSNEICETIYGTRDQSGY